MRRINGPTEWSKRVWVGARGVREYRGRQICADTDLHDRAIALLMEFAPPPALVADVGCGQGAFALRLVDSGFDVVGLDLASSSEHAPLGYSYEQLDLLSDDARAAFLESRERSFAVVVLLEVIEHVHNPWQVLEFCHSLLRPGGTLLLSTPNITSFFSRFRFLTSGRFHQFEPLDLTYGHVNPMTALMVERVLEDTGFELVAKRPGPPMPVLVWASGIRTFPGRVLNMASFLVAASLTLLMRGGDLDGWSLLFVARIREREAQG